MKINNPHVLDSKFRRTKYVKIKASIHNVHGFVFTYPFTDNCPTFIICGILDDKRSSQLIKMKTISIPNYVGLLNILSIQKKSVKI